MSQLVNAEVNSGNRNAELASNYAIRIRGRRTGMKCHAKGIEHSLHCVGLAKESKYQSNFTRKPLWLILFIPHLYLMLHRLDFFAVRLTEMFSGKIWGHGP